VVPALDVDELRAFAKAGGGVSRVLSRGRVDINSVIKLSNAIASPTTEGMDSKPTVDYWIERGVWLLPLLLLLSLGLFRRGLAL